MSEGNGTKKRNRRTRLDFLRDSINDCKDIATAMGLGDAIGPSLDAAAAAVPAEWKQTKVAVVFNPGDTVKVRAKALERYDGAPTLTITKVVGKSYIGKSPNGTVFANVSARDVARA